MRRVQVYTEAAECVICVCSASREMLSLNARSRIIFAHTRAHWVLVISAASRVYWQTLRTCLLLLHAHCSGGAWLPKLIYLSRRSATNKREEGKESWLVGENFLWLIKHRARNLAMPDAEVNLQHWLFSLFWYDIRASLRALWVCVLSNLVFRCSHRLWTRRIVTLRLNGQRFSCVWNPFLSALCHSAQIVSYVFSPLSQTKWANKHTLLCWYNIEREEISVEWRLFAQRAWVNFEIGGLKKREWV
jgi:hypothetical protein